MAYINTTPRAGIPDIIGVQKAPYSIGITGLPTSPLETFLGQIVTGCDNAATINAGGEFIYLAVATSTAIPLGTIVVWDASNYRATAMPTSSGNTARPVAVAINAITSDANNVQYAWFQIQGRAAVLKTAVTVPTNSRLFISGTAGRFHLAASAGKTIVGARTANAASVTSTTSTVLVDLYRPVLQGA